jgi:hypothetical protein
MAEQCKLLVAHWPSDLITAGALFEVLTGTSHGTLTAAHRHTLERHRIETLGKTIKVDGTSTRVSIIRNKDRWIDADANEIRQELAKAVISIEGAGETLLEAAAAAGEAP